MSETLSSDQQSLLRIAREMQEGPIRYYNWANTCEDAAAEIERLNTRLIQLQMPHAEVLRLAEREDGADALALINALYRKVDAQKREIARLQQRCKWYADSQEALRAKVCRQNDIDERGDA